MFFFRQAQVADIPELMKLDRQVFLSLWLKKQRRFLEPLNEEELKEKLCKTSTIIVAYCKNKGIIGFVHLEELSREDETSLKAIFSNFQSGKVLKICRIEILPEWQEHGQGMALLEEAKKYAKRNGFKQLVGMLHPKDIKAQKVLFFLWEDGKRKKRIRFSPKYLINMGENCWFRQRFLIDI